MENEKTLEDGISDEILEAALKDFHALMNKRGISQFEKKNYEVFSYLVMFIRSDHKRVRNLENEVAVLKQRNIVTWIISNPKVSTFLIGLIVFDYFIRYLETIKAFFQIK